MVSENKKEAGSSTTLGDRRGVHHALCTCCVRAVQNVGYVLPMAKVTEVPTGFPDKGLPQIPTQSNNSAHELKQTMFHTQNARMLSVFYLNLLFYLNLPCGRMLPLWWLVFRVVTGKLTCY